MSAPAYQSGTKAHLLLSGSNQTASIPAPSGVSVGDYLIVSLRSNTRLDNSGYWVPPSGWSSLGSYTDGTGYSVYVYGKVADSTDVTLSSQSGNYSWGVKGTASSYIDFMLSRHSNPSSWVVDTCYLNAGRITSTTTFSITLTSAIPAADYLVTHWHASTGRSAIPTLGSISPSETNKFDTGWLASTAGMRVQTYESSGSQVSGSITITTGGWDSGCNCGAVAVSFKAPGGASYSRSATMGIGVSTSGSRQQTRPRTATISVGLSTTGARSALKIARIISWGALSIQDYAIDSAVKYWRSITFVMGYTVSPSKMASLLRAASMSLAGAMSGAKKTILVRANNLSIVVDDTAEVLKHLRRSVSISFGIGIIGLKQLTVVRVIDSAILSIHDYALDSGVKYWRSSSIVINAGATTTRNWITSRYASLNAGIGDLVTGYRTIRRSLGFHFSVKSQTKSRKAFTRIAGFVVPIYQNGVRKAHKFRSLTLGLSASANNSRFVKWCRVSPVGIAIYHITSQSLRVFRVLRDLLLSIQDYAADSAHIKIRTMTFVVGARANISYPLAMKVYRVISEGLDLVEAVIHTSHRWFRAISLGITTTVDWVKQVVINRTAALSVGISNALQRLVQFFRSNNVGIGVQGTLKSRAVTLLKKLGQRINKAMGRIPGIGP